MIEAQCNDCPFRITAEDATRATLQHVQTSKALVKDMLSTSAGKQALNTYEEETVPIGYVIGGVVQHCQGNPTHGVTLRWKAVT